MSSNRYNRRTFVYSVAQYLRDKDFDGLDLDWEYPKGATDKKNFAELCTGIISPSSLDAACKVSKIARYAHECLHEDVNSLQLHLHSHMHVRFCVQMRSHKLIWREAMPAILFKLDHKCKY